MFDEEILKDLIKKQKELSEEIDRLKKKIKDSAIGDVRITRENKTYYVGNDTSEEFTLYRVSVLGNTYGYGKHEFRTRWQNLYVSKTKQDALNFLDSLEQSIRAEKEELKAETQLVELPEDRIDDDGKLI